jgi:hypothetical protein
VWGVGVTLSASEVVEIDEGSGVVVVVADEFVETVELFTLGKEVSSEMGNIPEVVDDDTSVVVFVGVEAGAVVAVDGVGEVGGGAAAPMTGIRGAPPWGEGERLLMNRFMATWSRCWTCALARSPCRRTCMCIVRVV